MNIAIYEGGGDRQKRGNSIKSGAPSLVPVAAAEAAAIAPATHCPGHRLVGVGS